MHIGVLTHNYPRFPGDFSGTFVEALCEEYVAQDQQVTVWAPYDPAYSRPLDDDVTLRLYRYAWPERLHTLGYMRSMKSDLALQLETYFLSPSFFASGIATLMREAKRTKPDVLHAHWLLPNGFIAAVVSKRLGIPLVVSVPGSDAQVAAKNALFRRMARFTFEQASLLTANSESLRDSIVALGADPAKFDMIIYGTDPQALKPAAKGVDSLCESLNIDPESVVLLCVGRMVHKKGFDILLHAMTATGMQKCPIVTVMVGDGDQQAEWQELATSLGIRDRIRWVGNVPKDEIGTYYNMADVLLMPSVSKPADGLNVCVLDAMSCAKPVVGSVAAGNPLAIIDGETGFLVPEQDPQALADALVTLIDDADLRRRLGAAGRERIETELGWPHLARRYIDHFERLATKRSATDGHG